MIETRNLSVKIGAKFLLEDVSLQVKTGEIVAVIGANGAGKSTLLKCLSGELKNLTGVIEFNQKSLKNWKADDLAKKRAVLPQNFALNFPFRAREVALLGRTPHIKFTETPRDLEIAENALKAVEAGHLAENFYPNLSGGEKQRVQLARVLAQIWEKQTGSNRYLLLDEPTASLDLAHQHLTLQTARKFAAAGTAVLCVLHDLNLAAQYADKILVLHAGKVVKFGNPHEVLTVEIIREVFSIEAFLTKHPKLNVPLVVALGNKKIPEKKL